MSRDPPLTFYEFFAGGGMARLGLGQAWACAFANDFDPVKVATYRQNFGGEDLVEGDVWKLSPADLSGRADLAWASSPCQDFSLAGARAGLKGGRSSAFFGFWRLIEALAAEDRAPRAIVIENVVGLLTSHGGQDFEALCRALAGQGYRVGALEIDTARFTPQSRPRVFILASREVKPELTGDSPFHTPAVRAAFDRLPADVKAAWVWWRLPAPPTRNTSLAAMIEEDDAVAWRSDADTARLLSLMSPAHRARLQQPGRTVGTVFRRTRADGQRAEVRTDGLAGCLRTPRGGSSRQTVVVAEDGAVRSRLMTGREGARLMGLPDSYVLPGSTTAALHVVGDGVAAPVVRWLAKHLLEPLLLSSAPAIAAE
ncbi:MAG TPA: DNA cytosine methyltransferase [Caulobacteraceae bacterium]|nr:DNA cytosine methyltransferase [Caulobacteraceae bacterium]